MSRRIRKIKQIDRNVERSRKEEITQGKNITFGIIEGFYKMVTL